MGIDLHKSGDYRISLIKKDLEPSPLKSTTKDWIPDTQATFGEYNPLLGTLNRNFSKNKIKVNSNDYFNIDLSDFLVDEQLRGNLELWQQTSSARFLNNFDIPVQEQLAMLFTNQQSFLNRQTEQEVALLKNTLIETYLDYDIALQDNIKKDVNLYITCLVKALSMKGNKVFAMKHARAREKREDGFYYDHEAKLIKMSELSSCENKNIFILVPFILKNSKSSFETPDIMFSGDIS